MDELQNIQDFIYVIRGQRVMLDFDLARIYQVENKQLKRQVRRNIERFEGDDFMFEVTQEEILRCQNVTSSWGGSRYNAFAFTEIGVAMLSGVLNSPQHASFNRFFILLLLFTHLVAHWQVCMRDFSQIVWKYQYFSVSLPPEITLLTLNPVLLWTNCRTSRTSFTSFAASA